MKTKTEATRKDSAVKGTEHTPTPWTLRKDRPMAFFRGTEKVGDTAGMSFSDMEAERNAAFIVRAVNSHDELLGLLMHCKEYLEGYAERPSLNLIEKAIAQAEGK